MGPTIMSMIRAGQDGQFHEGENTLYSRSEVAELAPDLVKERPQGVLDV
jgi:hypothetical protein